MANEGDTAIIWLEASNIDSSQEIKTLSRNDSFINYLKQSEVRESFRELKTVASQQLLKPPLLHRHESAGSTGMQRHDSAGSNGRPSTAVPYGYDGLQRESLVEPFSTSKLISDVVYEEQPTSHSDTHNLFLQNYHPERTPYNPEDRAKRLQPHQYLTPKRMDRSDCPSTPVQELNGYIDRGHDHSTLRSKHTESTNLFPTYNYGELKKDTPLSNTVSQLCIGESAPAKHRTTEFYLEYLKNIRKANQTATVKPKNEEVESPSPSFFNSNYYFSSSKSHKQLAPYHP